MQDRQPGAPGQYKATVTAAELQKLQAGEQFTITMVRDDQPIVEGTPYSKAAVLPDALAAIVCPDVLNPTPADAIAALLPRNGKAAMTNHLPMGGFKVTGLGTPTADGDAVPLGYANQNFTPAVESTEYPGCYYRPVNGVVEWVNPPMVPGVEYRTTERYKGSPVYVRKENVGTLANTGIIYINAFVGGIDAIVDDALKAQNSDESSHFTSHPDVSMVISTDAVGNTNRYVWGRIETKSDMSDYSAEVTVKYTKV